MFSCVSLFLSFIFCFCLEFILKRLFSFIFSSHFHVHSTFIFKFSFSFCVNILLHTSCRLFIADGVLRWWGIYNSSQCRSLMSNVICLLLLHFITIIIIRWIVIVIVVAVAYLGTLTDHFPLFKCYGFIKCHWY